MRLIDFFFEIGSLSVALDVLELIGCVDQADLEFGDLPAFACGVVERKLAPPRPVLCLVLNNRREMIDSLNWKAGPQGVSLQVPNVVFTGDLFLIQQYSSFNCKIDSVILVGVSLVEYIGVPSMYDP